MLPTSSATRALTLEYKSLQEEPVEGFRVKLANESNMFEWEVAIFGPPDTLYQGGYFKAIMKFPPDYPYSPPTLSFRTKVWHPNVYGNGNLCISILHPPQDDPTNTELLSEKWNPARTVRTVLLSVISLLNEPNTASPANVDASMMYRRWLDSKGEDKEYENLVKAQVQETKLEAEKEGVVVPTTIEEYCSLGKCSKKRKEVDNEEFDIGYFDAYDDDDEDDCNIEEELECEEGDQIGSA